MPEITVPSGAKVVVNQAGFQESMALKNAIVSELAKTNFAIGVDLKNLSLNQELNLESLVGAAMTVDSSPRVYAALLPCLARCLYNAEKITEATFEKPEAREDYYEIVFAVLKENLGPFFKGLLSRLKAMKQAAPVEKDQK